MEALLRRNLFGFLLIIIGFVLFIISYFLLPLYVSVVNCFDTCTPPIRRTMWDSSLQVLSNLNAPYFDYPFLALHYLPLLAALILFGCGMLLFMRPQHVFAVWFYRCWLTGFIALIIIFPFLLLFILPQIGYLGLLLSYGLFYGGYRLFVGTHPELQSVRRRQDGQA